MNFENNDQSLLEVVTSKIDNGINIYQATRKYIKRDGFSQIVQHLNFSVLQGDYILSSTKITIETLTKRVESFLTIIKEDKGVKEDLHEEFENLVKQIYEVLKLYYQLCNYFEGQLNKDQTSSSRFFFINETSKLFESEEIEEIADTITNSRDSSLNTFVNLFKANVLLAELDSSIECSEKFLHTLLSINHSFKQIKETTGLNITQGGELYEILKDKSKFLIYKVLKRLNYDSIIDEKFDGINAVPISIDKFTEIKYYKQFLEICKINYSKDFNNLIWIKEEEKRIELNEELTINRVHYKSKLIYKKHKVDQDFDKNFASVQDKINSLVHNFSREIKEPNYSDENLIKFNQLAANNVCFLLLKNKLKTACDSLLKILMQENLIFDATLLLNIKKYYKHAEKNFNDVKEFVQKLQGNKGPIQDYYHELIFTNAVVKVGIFCLENSINSDSLYTEWKKIRLSFLNLFKENIKNDKSLGTDIYEYVENKIKISQSCNYLPIYLTFKECLIELPKHDKLLIKNLFLDSSYVLPINFHSQYRAAEQLKNDFRFIDYLESRVTYSLNMFEQLRTKITKSEDDVKETIKKEFNLSLSDVQKKLSDKVKDANISGIQIIGTFTSVLAIIVVFTNTVPKSDSLVQGILYMLGFALCIFFFLYNLKVILNKPDEVKPATKPDWKVTIVVGIIACLTFGYIYVFNDYFKRYSAKKVSIEYQNNMDSFKNKKITIDTFILSDENFIIKQGDTVVVIRK